MHCANRDRISLLTRPSAPKPKDAKDNQAIIRIDYDLSRSTRRIASRENCHANGLGGRLEYKLKSGPPGQNGSRAPVEVQKKNSDLPIACEILRSSSSSMRWSTQLPSSTQGHHIPLGNSRYDVIERTLCQGTWRLSTLVI